MAGGRKNKNKSKDGAAKDSHTGAATSNGAAVTQESKKRKQDDRDKSSKDESIESINSTNVERDLQLQRMDAEIFELRDMLMKQGEDIKRLTKENVNLKDELNEERYLNKVLASDLNLVQQYTRKNNLRVFGLDDVNKKETAEMSEEIVLRLFQQKLGLSWLSHRDIEIAHRTGRFSATSKRPIIVRFISRKVKNAVIYNRRKLKGTKVSIQEDLTAQNLKRLNQIRELECVELAWSYDGKLFAKNKNQQTKEIRAMEALTESLFEPSVQPQRNVTDIRDQSKPSRESNGQTSNSKDQQASSEHNSYIRNSDSSNVLNGNSNNVSGSNPNTASGSDRSSDNNNANPPPGQHSEVTMQQDLDIASAMNTSASAIPNPKSSSTPITERLQNMAQVKAP